MEHTAVENARLDTIAKVIAAAVGGFLAVFGLWAMLAPKSFFDAFAEFDPYNQHFLQDIGAFQIGLGAVLLLAALRPAVGALAVALVGVGIGSAAHVISHAVGTDLGGRPAVDIPFFGASTGLLLVAGVLLWRR
jgi:hypothetical protein